MPTPESPVVPGLEPFEIRFGEGQPDYQVLPGLCGRRPYYAVMSRWKLTNEERELIAKGADVYVSQMTFGNGLQPSLVTVANADDMGVVHDVINEQFGYGEQLNERIRSL